MRDYRMKNKKIGVIFLTIAGVYFLLFHTEPFPLNHVDIGLPPYHVAHALFGLALLVWARYIWKKK